MKTNFKKFYWGENTEVIFQPFTKEPKDIPITACMAMATLNNEYLVLSSPQRGWGLPGGHREKGETPQETIIRELYEETAVKINQNTLKIVGGWFIKKIHKTEKNNKYPDKAYMLLFIADITQVKQFTKRFEIYDRAFVPIKDVFKYSYGENFKPIFTYISQKYDKRFIKKKHQDKVSIIVPFHNLEKYISKCVENIINQTYQNIEILLINDKSTDKSKEICKKYIEKDKRVRLINHRKEKRIHEAIDTGLDFVTGNYIYIANYKKSIGRDTISELLLGSKEKADIVGYKKDSKDNIYNKIYSTYLIKNNHIAFKEEKEVITKLYENSTKQIFL